MRGVTMIIVVHPAPAATAAAATAGHGHAALFADLRVLCFHAGGDFHPIRDDIGTQPHRVGRTNLLNVNGGRTGGALGAGLVKAAKEQRADRQCQPANEKRGPHLSYPGLEKNSRSRAKLADPPSMVQAKNPGYPAGLWLPVQWKAQAKPRPVRGRFPAMSLVQRSMPPSTITAVTLSKDMCRQNIPSGMVTTTSPVLLVSRASTADCKIGSIAAWPPISKAAVKSTRNSEETMTMRPDFARSSSMRARERRRASAVTLT